MDGNFWAFYGIFSSFVEARSWEERGSDCSVSSSTTMFSLASILAAIVVGWKGARKIWAVSQFGVSTGLLPWCFVIFLHFLGTTVGSSNWHSKSESSPFFGTEIAVELVSGVRGNMWNYKFDNVGFSVIVWRNANRLISYWFRPNVLWLDDECPKYRKSTSASP